MINLQKTMENENDFRIRTYTKKELACLYCPNATELLLTGYHVRVRTFMPRQVGIIVHYLDEP